MLFSREEKIYELIKQSKKIRMNPERALLKFYKVHLAVPCLQTWAIGFFELELIC